MSDYRTRSVEEIGEALVEIAKRQQCEHYREFAESLGMSPHVRNWQNHPLCKIFGHLDRQDHAASRPFRTAVIVKSGPDVPGPGFFLTITKLRQIEVPPEFQKKFWELELELVHAFYKVK